MTPLARGYSFVMYLAEAGATYTIPLPFLHTDDVRVFAGDVGDAVEQSYTWTSPTSIQLAGALPAGILVTIRRFTPRDRTLVEVQDGAQLPASDLNLNSKQLLYIMQEQIDFGTYGGHGLPGGGSGWPDGNGAPSLPIQQIIDALMASPIMAILTTRLDDIDNTAETLMEELLRSDQTFDQRRKTEGRLALAESTLETIEDNSKSVAMQITELFAKFDDSAAQFIQVNKAIATETEARVTSGTQLSAAIKDNLAQITIVSQAVATEADVRAQAITKVVADFKQADDTVTKAITQTLQTSYATKDYAQAVASTAVEAFSNGKYAHLEQRFEALVDGTNDPDGQWQANYSVRINAGSINGVPVIAGIGLGVDRKTGSSFIVMADRFGFVSPTYTSNGGVQQMKYPFVIGTVGGVSTVGIQGQLMVDGSVTADKIRTNTLSALSANMGEVNGGTFRTFQLDANGAIINPQEFRCELTNNPGDAYPVWVGAGVKNYNNAVFAVDRAGNAKFAGKITANNMIGTLQSNANAVWTGDITASSNGVGPIITLSAPALLGEVQLPLIHVETKINNPSGNPATGGIYLERLSGSTWVTVKVHNHLIGGGATDFDSLLAFDAPTTGAVQYRVRIGLDPYSQTNSGNFHGTAITIYAIGMR
ncbi:hypothetical protein HDE76_000721 [Rhodanobacter sp. ANJX3]|uniref:phage tail fiber domain-containing protein n=1 Tax=Rhodanobacter sp. ANJX3 TaxID=2723083 RepID=UPI00161883A8|nr:phage tail fiber protein [Rhodanobacter sp. ANJX3]MBB5357539.1 hypothetical protein [Rhodanobacter sp. ANJX3]